MAKLEAHYIVLEMQNQQPLTIPILAESVYTNMPVWASSWNYVYMQYFGLFFDAALTLLWEEVTRLPLSFNP